MAIACPADEAECRQLLSTAHAQNQPVAVRYPRGAGVGATIPTSLDGLPFGKGEVRRQGKGIAILAFGTLLHPALAAGEKLGATVANMRWAKPLDVALLRELAASHEALVTVEEGCLPGGAGSAVMEALQSEGLNCRCLLWDFPTSSRSTAIPPSCLLRWASMLPVSKRPSAPASNLCCTQHPV
jgi:1-deoxy-D-xylulose-5-phosphate synthase